MQCWLTCDVLIFPLRYQRDWFDVTDLSTQRIDLIRKDDTIFIGRKKSNRQSRANPYFDCRDAGGGWVIMSGA